MNQGKELIYLQSFVKHFGVRLDVKISNDNSFDSIAGVKVAVVEEISISNTTEFEVNCFIQGYQVYLSISQAKIGEKLTAVMEPNNIAD